MTIISTLRKAEKLDKDSDFHAAGYDLRTASAMMKECNQLRASVFGKLEPAVLRLMANEYLGREP